MAMKFICDRCSKETMRGFSIIVPPKKQIDLCEECAEKFQDFMKKEDEQK